ncbi:uncharacterized protein LOC108115550 [Drosophila eugracilis]|uniref:uncharacterized protein LOC108115550 n=1 Tax=Drosophila eugracilis TaxID=29029 RepID=UPI001BD99896|nr:uncharacterized protein LOC108115550 [Drosophila eugracilis]
MCIIFPAGYAIKCHSCTRENGCGQDKRFVVDCNEYSPTSDPTTSCYKISFTGESGKTMILEAGCKSVIDACGIITKKVWPIPVNCAYCNEDECNGSSSMVPIAGTILLFFGVARLLA